MKCKCKLYADDNALRLGKKNSFTIKLVTLAQSVDNYVNSKIV